MKFKSLLLCSTTLLGLILSSCGDNHVHTFEEGWSHDEQYHYHKSTCGHDDIRGNQEEHTFVTSTVSPTFEAQGYTLHECSVCHYSYKDTYVDKKDHHFEDTLSYNENGHYHRCTDAGYESTIFDLEEHTFKEGVVVDPTFEEQGYTLHECEKCDYSYKDNYVEAKEHNYYTFWSKDENTHWHGCRDAGYSTLKADEAAHEPVLEHKDPTYTQYGYDKTTCSVCGYVISNVSIPKLTHNYSSEWSNNETHHWKQCIDEGYTHLETGRATHVGGEWVVDQAPTFNESGSKHQVCTVCGKDFNYTEIPSELDAYSDEKLSITNNSNPLTVSSCLRDATRVKLPTTGYNIYRNEYCPVDSIGVSAFQNCTRLEEVIIPEGYKSINQYAFKGCKNLTRIVLPSTITSIGTDAFADCNNLAEVVNLSSSINITIGNTSANGGIGKYVRSVLNSTDAPTKVIISNDGLVSVDNYLVGVLPGHKKVVVDDSYTGISNYAFTYNKELEEVDLSANTHLAALPNQFFYSCINLKTVKLNEAIVSIGAEAFRSCNSLVDFVIPSNVNSIGSKAFMDCESLEEMSIPSGVNILPSTLFGGCKSLRTLTLENNSYTEIPAAFVSGCHNLTGFVIPDSVTKIGNSAFSQCYKLHRINFPSGLTTIESYAFEDCYRIVEIVNQSSLDVNYSNLDGYGKLNNYRVHNITTDPNNTILEYRDDDFVMVHYHTYHKLLDYLGNDKHVYIPDDITDAHDYCLYDVHAYSIETNNLDYLPDNFNNANPDLLQLVIGPNVTGVYDQSYSAISSDSKVAEIINLSSLNITAGSYNNGAVARTAKHVYTSLSDKHIEVEAEYIVDGDGVLYHYQGNEEEIVLPNNITAIADNAFKNDKQLKKVTLSNNVTSIGQYAFSGSLVEEVVMNEGVSSIGAYAFYCAERLRKINVPSSVTSIGNYAFSGTCSLEDIEYLATASIAYYQFTLDNVYTDATKRTPLFHEFIIPEGVTTINNYGLYSLNQLTAIYLPSTLTTIYGNGLSSLNGYKVKIFYNGTVSDFEKISMAGSTVGITKNTSYLYYYSETQPTKSGNYWHYVDGVMTIWEN